MISSSIPKKRGFSAQEILISLVFIGLLAALSLPFIVNSNNADSAHSNILTGINTTILEAFDKEKIQYGLIARSTSPASIIEKVLNKGDSSETVVLNNGNELPSACANALLTPAKKIPLKTPDTVIIAEQGWKPDEQGRDYTHFCITNTKKSLASVGEVYREEDTGNIILSNAHPENTNLNTPSIEGVDIAPPQDISSVSDPESLKNVNVKIQSVYTGKDLNSDLEDAVIELLNTKDGTVITGSVSNPFKINVNDIYEVKIRSLPDLPKRAFVASGDSSIISPNSPNDDNVTLLVEDYNELSITAESAFSNLPRSKKMSIKIDRDHALNLQAAYNTQPFAQTEEKSTSNIIQSTWLVPAGKYKVELIGDNMLAHKQNLDLTSPISLRKKLSVAKSVSMLGTVAYQTGPSANTQTLLSFLWNYSYNAHLYGDWYTVGGYGWHYNAIQSFARTWGFYATWVANNTGALGTTYNGIGANSAHSGYLLVGGITDHQTHTNSLHQSAYVASMKAVRSPDGRTFWEDAEGNLYGEGTVSLTPIKVSMAMKDVFVNSDDHFNFDIDGFRDSRLKPLTTPGGLNANEAWLILDRDRNGTWQNNALDNDDLFGDHLGRVDNGYIDLQNTFAHEIKIDPKGNRYIDLEDHQFWGESQLWFTRTFLGDTIPYAAYDLKLLNRSRQLVPARELIDRVYVDYWDVNEYDQGRRNSIRQRAWVKYKNGHFARSGDEYFTFRSIGLKRLSPAEEARIRKELEASQKTAP